MARPTKLAGDQKYRDAFMKNLRMLMARDEISVRELAKRTGYSTSAIVKYRKGLWSVSLTRVYRIAEALGCSVYDLIDESVA